MSKRRLSLDKYMQDQRLVRVERKISHEEYRREIENSDFIAELEHTADGINQSAGTLVVDVHSYLPPEPLIRSFSVHQGREEYSMQVEVWHKRLVLTFVLRREKANLFAQFLPWIFAHWMGLHETEMSVAFSSRVEANLVTSRDVEAWFIYLLSGFDGKHTPVIPALREEARARKVRSGSSLALDETFRA